VRVLALVAVLGLDAGCALRARQHPCWAYLAKAYGDRVPPGLVDQLARESDARKQVARLRAPAGYYWRRITARPPVLDPPRTAAGDHELVPCPGRPGGPPR
jgi:hypothetical protein